MHTNYVILIKTGFILQYISNNTFNIKIKFLGQNSHSETEM